MAAPLRTAPRLPIFYGWAIVAVAFVTLGLGYSAWHTFSLFFVAVLEEFGWSRASTAAAFSIFAIVYALASPWAGALADRFGPRRVIPGGAVVLALGLAASSRMSAPWHWYFSYGLVGAIGASAVGSVPNFTAVQNWFARRRGLALGLASSGIGIGILVLAPLTQFVISTAGWRQAYLVLMGLMLIIPPLAWFFHRLRPEDMGLRPDGDRGVGEPESGRRPPTGDEERRVVDKAWAAREWTLARALGTRRFWLVFGSAALSLFTTQMVIVHQVAFFTDTGYDKLLAASVVGLVGAIASGGKILWGGLSDRIGREVAFALGAGCTLIALGLLLTMRGATQLWPLYAYALFMGLGNGAFAPLMPSTISDIFQGRSFGAIYGFLYLAHALGSAGGPWLGGYIFDATRSYILAFVIAVAAAAAAALCLWLAAPRRVRRVSGRLPRLA